MSRVQPGPAHIARDEQLDALLGIRGKDEDRALTVGDLDGVVLEAILDVVRAAVVIPGALSGNPMALRPAAGVVIGNHVTSALTTGAGAVNAERIAPFVAPYDFSIDQVGLSVSTAVGGSNLKVTIYEADPFGRPARNVFESGNISGAAVATVMLAASFKFQAGRSYWLGVRYSANTTLRVAQPYASAVLSWSTAGTPAGSSVLQRTLAFATAATDWVYGSGDHVAQRAPLILMRVA